MGCHAEYLISHFMLVPAVHIMRGARAPILGQRIDWGNLPTEGNRQYKYRQLLSNYYCSLERRRKEPRFAPPLHSPPLHPPPTRFAG